MLNPYQFWAIFSAPPYITDNTSRKSQVTNMIMKEERVKRTLSSSKTYLLISKTHRAPASIRAVTFVTSVTLHHNFARTGTLRE